MAAHLLDGDLRHVAVYRDGHVLPIEQPIASAPDGRQYDVTATGTTGFDQPLEVMNPRLLRLGIRWNF